MGNLVVSAKTSDAGIDGVRLAREDGAWESTVTYGCNREWRHEN